MGSGVVVAIGKLKIAGSGLFVAANEIFFKRSDGSRKGRITIALPLIQPDILLEALHGTPCH